MASKRCVRCESLERKQKTRQIIYTGPEDSIPVCLVCMQEIAELDKFFKEELEEEEDEFGGEITDSESC